MTLKASPHRIDRSFNGFESAAPLGPAGHDLSFAEFKAMHRLWHHGRADSDPARYYHPYSCPVCGMGTATEGLALECCERMANDKR